MNIEQYKNGTREIGGGKSKERGKEGKREREVERSGGEGRRGESIMYTCIPLFVSSIHYRMQFSPYSRKNRHNYSYLCGDSTVPSNGISSPEEARSRENTSRQALVLKQYEIIENP